MSIHPISAVWLVVFGLLSLPVAAMESDVVEDNEPQAERINLEEFPPYVLTQKFFDSLYRKAEAAQPGPDDYEKDCMVLDDEVSMLMPLTYRYVPGFYSDPKNAFAIWMGTLGVLSVTDVEVLDVPLWYGYLGFSGYKRHAEEVRIRKANLRIGALRRVKARKRCFESF
ncbi:hypothetical protein [Sulfuriflexus mobilis]|uniref:hypothetical protein n=1 Tax=Sulfuriflexus mobilis TaxID=1811807 RepID=UPI000F821D7B|nr:hypothetical protein [Sulfuriflexus mobilis]